jgi:hypothetical protein
MPGQNQPGEAKREYEYQQADLSNQIGIALQPRPLLEPLPEFGYAKGVVAIKTQSRVDSEPQPSKKREYTARQSADPLMAQRQRPTLWDNTGH